MGIGLGQKGRIWVTLSLIEVLQIMQSCMLKATRKQQKLSESIMMQFEDMQNGIFSFLKIFGHMQGNKIKMHIILQLLELKFIC